jgi:hypothetical protein
MFIKVLSNIPAQHVTKAHLYSLEYSSYPSPNQADYPRQLKAKQSK